MESALGLIRRHAAVSLALCCALAAPLHANASDLKVETLWVTHADMVMEAAPMVVDLDGDGAGEILTAAYENIIVMDGSGKERWRFDTRGRYSTCPAILEREGQPPLIFAGDNTGLFTCLDGLGAIVWQQELKSVFCASPALADLEHDGVLEVIQGEQGGRLVVMSALTGDIKWTIDLGGPVSCPAVGDLDGDGVLEVVAADATGAVYALEASGELRWTSTTRGAAPFWSVPSPVLFVNARGEVRIAAGFHEGRVFCLDQNGEPLWSQAVRGPLGPALSVGDLDADGRVDLFAVTELGVLYRFDESGQVLWDIDVQGRGLAPGALIDLDGDGTLEFLLCTQRGNLLALNAAGEILYNHQFDHRAINMTAAFGDIVPARPGLEFAVTGGESGQFYCFGTSAPAGSTGPWRTYRGDNRLTGAWLGLANQDTVRMLPENLEWDRVLTGGTVDFRVVIPSADGGTLTAEATCIRPDGSRQVAVGKVAGREGLLKLPLVVSAPGTYRFAWTLKNAGGEALVDGARDVTLQPFQNDQALARRSVLEIQNSLAGADAAGSGLAAALTQEARSISEETGLLANRQSAAPGAAPEFLENLRKQTAALSARAMRTSALAHIAPAVAATGSPIVAFTGSPWESREVDQMLPRNVEMPLNISRRCVPGEHEPVSLKLLNTSLETVAVKARATVTEGGPAVRLFEAQAVPTNQGVDSWDALVPLDDREMSIPALETREVLVDIDLAGQKAGTQSVQLAFGTGASETRAEIALDILPFEMAGEGAMRLCCWATYNDDAVRDLLAHGNTVFITGLPPATVAGGANPAISIDFATLDGFVAPLKGHDVFLLMSGIPSLGVPMEDTAYVERLAVYLDQLFDHLAGAGISADQVALYPHDEPGGNGWDTVKHYVKFGQQALKARPGLQLYVNGGGDLAMFEALNEVAAIWCPSYFMLPDSTPVMNFLRNSVKALWTYDCAYAYARPVGANVKTINVVAQYRLAPVYGFHFGATGVGYWCYNVGPSMWDPIEMEYPLVYTNSDNTQTTSRRWEAVREGMEDTRILLAMQAKLSDPAVGDVAKTKIRALMDGVIANLSRQSLQEAQLGVARYVLDASNNDTTVENLRNTLMDCVEALAAGQ